MKNTRTHMQIRRVAHGLSLVELMVAVVIGLFLVIGTTTVYVNSRKTSDVDDSIARLQETARYAMAIIEPDVVMANYWGLAKDGTGIENKLTQTGTTITGIVTATPALATCGTNYAIDVEFPVAASNNTYSFGCTANGGAVTSSDTLTIRRAEAAPAAAVDSNYLQLCSSRSNVSVIHGGTCVTTHQVHNMKVHGYYVSQQSSGGTTLPSLRRKTLISGPAFRDDEIVPGVEDMQIQIGWDATGEQPNATSYYNPGNTAMTATGQIVAVRVWLLIRAESPDPSYTDNTTYEYADRSTANGTTNDLSGSTAGTQAYAPADNFRRLLVSRTFFIRNTVGT